MDDETGELLHIDLNVAFDKGRLLKAPEMVPFRLTQNILEGMSLIERCSVFPELCCSMLSRVRLNSKRILMLLETFLFDSVTDFAAKKKKKKLQQQDQKSASLATLSTNERDELSPEMWKALAENGESNDFFISQAVDVQQVSALIKACVHENDSKARFLLIEAMRAVFPALQQISSDLAALACQPTVNMTPADVGAIGQAFLDGFRGLKCRSAEFGFAEQFLGNPSNSGRKVIREVETKLKGGTQGVSVQKHVQELIDAATDSANLSGLFPGWSAWL